jgi:hypothetical protein
MGYLLAPNGVNKRYGEPWRQRGWAAASSQAAHRQFQPAHILYILDLAALRSRIVSSGHDMLDMLGRRTPALYTCQSSDFLASGVSIDLPGAIGYTEVRRRWHMCSKNCTIVLQGSD